MRVALVVERLEPGGGGVENVAWRVAHGLAAAGEDVHVVARRAVPTDAFAVRRVRVPRVWQPLRVLLFSAAAARAAPRGGYDVVHSFARTRHQDLYRAGGGSHADYLAHQYPPAGRALRRLSPRHRVLLGIERRVFADASQRIQCNSRMVRDALVARHGVDPGRVVVLYNGVDLERFHPGRREREGKAVRESVGAGEAPVWLLLGSGWRRKGLEVALRALAAGGPAEAELWVAGRDDPEPWRARAARLGVGARVRFLGTRSDPEALCAAADALLLPTRYDAFANACLEAAAAGLPVVTSGSNGAAEVLGEGGMVVGDADDVAGFARALDALADPAARRARGHAARAAAEGLGWDAHVAALRALYGRIAPR